ncbi:Gamma-aminobutyric acid type B receptor subunit 2 [Hypsibius exemplaris]|uniref:Gamma-aminobutyric acid type B receptor subunit 2 n=1 Tax=Hypsibius exemplaris TaxID=2072580 RepID=A0A1W0WY56_HYPEX|nr:Gamma-aminobutyric acid type B receptor subunit 2 [Hypsibius exemplaris]
MCSVGEGIYAFLDALFLGPRIHFLLGPSDDEVAIELARASPYWAMLQISAGATSPALSDRNHFRYFFRTITPDQSHNNARLEFLRHFRWQYAATINENTESYALAMNALVGALEDQNITFRATGSIGESKIREQLELFKEKDARILFGAFSVEFAKQVFCEAFRLGLYGSRYVWFLSGSYPVGWWKNRANETTCTTAQLEKAIDGYISVTTSDALMNNKVSAAGITYEEFIHLLDENSPSSTYSPQALAFDAIWTIALAVQKSLPVLERNGLRWMDYDDTNQEIAQIVAGVLSRLDFPGISGPIRFSGADRVGVSVFRQFVQKETNTIAMYYPDEGLLSFNCSGCEPVSWEGSRKPADRRHESYVIEVIETEVFVSITIISFFGIIIACLFLLFNFRFRNEKFIKLSSPKLNNTTALGCCLVYASVISLGIDFGITGDLYYSRPICHLRIFFFSTGFSVAFGSLFLKTFRVHQIFRKASRGVIKSKLLRDNQLLSGVGLLFILDCILLTIWFLVDPIRVELRPLPEIYSLLDPDVILRRDVEVCSSDYMGSVWLPFLYMYKGLMLLAGIFLTFETRHVKIPALNDSQAVGLSIYNVVICSVIAFAVTQIILEHHTLHFVLIASLTIATTTGTLCFLFLPKILTVVKKNTGDDPMLSASGLKVECNTRRLAIEDPRERYIRAEIQNRVCKLDMNDIEVECDRLESLLRLPITPYMKVSESVLLSLPEYFVDDEKTVQRCKFVRSTYEPPKEEKAKGKASFLMSHLQLHRTPSMTPSHGATEDSVEEPDEPRGNNTETMVMETDEGNVTLIVQKSVRGGSGAAAPGGAATGMAAKVKFRRAMVRYKFTAIKPTAKRVSAVTVAPGCNGNGSLLEEQQKQDDGDEGEGQES